MDKLMKKLPLIAMVFGAVAMVFYVFLGVIKVDLGMFGMTETINGLDAMSDGKFVFWIFLAILLLIGGVVCSLLAHFKPEMKLFSLIAAACYAVAVIFIFSTKGFYLTAHDAKELADMFKLAYGAIIAAICGIFAAAASAANALLNK